MFSIAGQAVTIEQAQLSYAFNPLLFAENDPKQAKEKIISALIAQQLLAAEAERVGFNDTTISMRIEAHKREAIIEKFRSDVVESKVVISYEDLKAEYQRAVQEFELAFFNLDEHNNIVSTQSKNLSWPIQNPELEQVVYDLNVGQESGILKTGSHLYKVKVLASKQVQSISENDFNRRKPALMDHIRRRKIRKIYSDFFFKKIEPKMGTVNFKIVDRLAKNLSLKIDNTAPNQQGLFGAQKELPQNLISEIKFDSENNLQQVAVIFPSGETWSVEKLLNALKYGPYAFNFSNPRLFQKSFHHNAQLLLEHQAIYTLALEQGYAMNDQVVSDTEMWRNFFLADAFRYTQLSNNERSSEAGAASTNKDTGLDLVQQNRLNYMDQLLVDLLRKNKLKMNIRAFKALGSTKTDMVLMKSHFAHRQVVPPIEPLSGLPVWQKEMHHLLNSYSMQ